MFSCVCCPAESTDTVAVPAPDGNGDLLYGYKFFSSACDSDMALALARPVQPDTNDVVAGTGGLALYYLECRQPPPAADERFSGDLAAFDQLRGPLAPGLLVLPAPALTSQWRCIRFVCRTQCFKLYSIIQAMSRVTLAGREAEGEDGHATAADRRTAARRRARAPAVGDGPRRAVDRADAHHHARPQRGRLGGLHAPVSAACPATSRRLPDAIASSSVSHLIFIFIFTLISFSYPYARLSRTRYRLDSNRIKC